MAQNERKFAATTKKTNIGRATSKKRKFVEILSQTASAVGSSSAADFEHSYFRLDTIIDDCLRHLFRYLDIMDVVNLAATSTFAKTDYFPKKGKEIIIEKKNKEKLNTVALNVSIFLKPIPNITLQSLETAFSYFGKFVELLAL